MAKLNQPAWIALLLALALAAPAVAYPVFLMKALCFALFACALNLLLGYAGLLSFGHAAFFGSAAYLTGQAVKVWGLPTELGILLGTALAAALGLIVGVLAIRRKGIYFAMITLALSQMVYFYQLGADYTGGEDGLQAIPRGKLLGLLSLRNDLAMYYFVLAVFALGFFVMYRAIHSPFGQVLKAIRENEPRAISLGYDVTRYKLLAFVLSATLAGLAGSTKALVFQLAALSDVHWGMSGEVVLMTLVGGIGTLAGPAVGAIFIVTMQHYLAGFGEWVQVVQGAVFVTTVLAFRRGIVGELLAWTRSRSAAAAARSAAQAGAGAPALERAGDPDGGAGPR
jgi:branched-chain amino acid transport system permease protein